MVESGTQRSGAGVLAQTVYPSDARQRELDDAPHTIDQALPSTVLQAVLLANNPLALLPDLPTCCCMAACFIALRCIVPALRLIVVAWLIACSLACLPLRAGQRAAVGGYL